MDAERLTTILAALTLSSLVACTAPTRERGTLQTHQNRPYRVISCRGMHMNGVRCPADMPITTKLRNAIVCQAALENATSPPVAASELPQSLCAQIEGGCTPYVAPGAPVLAEPDAAQREQMRAAGFTFATCGDGADFRVERLVRNEAGDLVDDVPATMAALSELPATLVREGTVQSAGLGVCCVNNGETLPEGTLCLRVSVKEENLDAVALTRAIATKLTAIEGRTVRIDVDVERRAQPRCDSSDRNCGPISGRGACLEEHGFSASAPRARLSVAINAGVDLARYSHGRCRGDGECMVGGCGQHCTATTDPMRSSTCEAVPALETALCGCVRGECQWFLQP